MKREPARHCQDLIVWQKAHQFVLSSILDSDSWLLTLEQLPKDSLSKSASSCRFPAPLLRTVQSPNGLSVEASFFMPVPDLVAPHGSKPQGATPPCLSGGLFKFLLRGDSRHGVPMFHVKPDGETADAGPNTGRPATGTQDLVLGAQGFTLAAQRAGALGPAGLPPLVQPPC